jgi:hypothetical protein
MMRVFIVLAIIVFLLSLWYAWGGVTIAEKRKAHMVGELRITAITTSYILLSGGKETVVEHAPTNTTMADGWATYLCLTEIGHVYFVDDFRTAHTHMPSKEFIAITNTGDFKKCVAERIDDAISKISQAKILALALSLGSVLLLYLVLLIATPVVVWVAKGFH